MLDGVCNSCSSDDVDGNSSDGGNVCRIGGGGEGSVGVTVVVVMVVVEVKVVGVSDARKKVLL